MRIMNMKLVCHHGLLLAGLTFMLSLIFAVGAELRAQTTAPKPGLKPISSIVSAKQTEELNPSLNKPISSPLPAKKPLDGVREEASNIVMAAAIPEDFFIPAIELAPTNKSVFSDKQARFYREIFEFQEAGDFDEADKRIAGLNNSILMGHILAERYLQPLSPNASYADLQKWMDLYADHPQASKIYKLAIARKPKRAVGPLKKPMTYKAIVGNFAAVSKTGARYQTTKKRDSAALVRVNKLTGDIKRHIKQGEPTIAANILSNDFAVQYIDNVEYDRLRALIAAGYLYAGKLNQAEKLAQESFKRSGDAVPLAGWVKGLVNWQRRQYESAAKGFEVAAISKYSSGWMVSASAYWASRAHMRVGNTDKVSQWLNVSASYPRTFYGLIATRALGHDSHFDWSIPDLSRDHIKYIESTKKGARANALIRAGRTDLAEAELRNINPGDSVFKQQALMAYANHYKLSALSLRLGNAYAQPDGSLYDAALYPIISWEPKSGYRIDQALIHAIIRQESRFHATAINPSGATGLMQLMPITANYVSGENIYQDVHGQYLLRNPSVNLDIGQKYIEELLNHKAVGQDLLSMAMAYNAGPGNLSRWKSERAHIQDPLLFIETIPFSETRAFVERVLSNYWIYRMRLNQKTPSLDAVAEGKWARYASQESENSSAEKLASR